MSTKRFIYPVASDTFIRREQVIERGKVIRFVVQLEVELAGEAKPVIRYDTAHGFAHIDRLSRIKDTKRIEQEMVARQLELIFEFERYLLEHPEFSKQIPDEAVICFQVKGEESFNRWSRHVAQERAEKERKPLVYIAIHSLRPVRSRIEKLKLAHVP